MTADLPRCAICRVTLKPAETVLFRPDGRVQHVACPEVICPVCDRAIRPSDPIRRDGDGLLHGNCWIKRARSMSRADAGGADLTAVIRGKLAAGALPRTPATRLWAGPGGGGVCAACGEPTRSQVEYEVEFASAVSVRFHRVCYGIWDEERTKISRDVFGSGAASL